MNKRRRNSKAKKEIRKLLLKRNFKEETKLVKYLREINKHQLESFLISQKMPEIARAMKKEKMNGIDFIILFSEEEGLDILINTFCFPLSQIEELKDLYLQIYNYRSRFCKNFDEDEYPFFLNK